MGDSAPLPPNADQMDLYKKQLLNPGCIRFEPFLLPGRNLYFFAKYVK
jgi:hypothetical protein